MPAPLPPDLRIPGPTLSIGRFPTPVVELVDLAPVASARFFCKREDLSDPTYGGHKVRKLQHLLARAREHGGPVLTAGAVGSHHLLGTAVHARAAAGLDTWAIVGPQPDTAHVREHARALSHHAAGIVPIRSWKELPVALARAEARIRQQTGGAPFHVPLGGSSVEGNLGSVALGLELAADVAAGRLPHPDHVFVAAGSGGTAVGLWVGLRLAGLSSEIVAVRTAPRVMINLPRLRAMAGSLLRTLGRTPAVPLHHNPLRLVHDHFGDDYGAPTPQGVEAARLARELHGIALDQTYSAKAMAACLDAQRRREVGGVVLFVATASAAPIEPLLIGAPAEVPPELAALLLPAGPVGRAG